MFFFTIIVFIFQSSLFSKENYTLKDSIPLKDSTLYVSGKEAVAFCCFHPAVSVGQYRFVKVIGAHSRSSKFGCRMIITGKNYSISV